jgi:hypothetical protein
MTGRSNAPHSFRQRCCFPATAFACHEPANRSGTVFLLHIVHTLFELESGSKATAEFKLQRFKKHQKGSKFQLNLKFQKKTLSSKTILHSYPFAVVIFVWPL